MAKFSKDDEMMLINDWTEVLRDFFWDNDWSEVSESERARITKYPKQFNRLNNDMSVFGNIMLEVAYYRQKDKDSYFYRSKDVRDFMYGGTECRLYFRTYMMLLGYKTYGNILASDMDWHGTSYAIECFANSKSFNQWRYNRNKNV